ncbi:MAG: hypothetical protein JKX69_04990 [Rhodobacteraceae bacterium]|nr:hypothetical protein [Paracoccaceae bacterium]
MPKVISPKSTAALIDELDADPKTEIGVPQRSFTLFAFNAKLKKKELIHNICKQTGRTYKFQLFLERGFDGESRKGELVIFAAKEAQS